MVIGRQFRRDRKSGLWTPNRRPPLQSRVNWQHPISRGLVACYLMNEGGGNQIFDIAGNYTGVFRNILSWVADQDGPAIYFDGTNTSITLPAGFAKYTDKFTISNWIKTTTDGRHTISRRKLSTATEYDFYLNSGVPRLYPGAVHDAATAVTDGLWHNTAVVINGTNSQFYLDGKPDGNTFNPTINGDAQDVRIGSWNGGNNNEFVGWMKNMLVFNQAKTASEVTQLYREPYCFIESPWPNRGALFEAAAAGGISMPVAMLQHDHFNGGIL